MLFNSYIFVLAFLPIVLLIWWSPVLNTRFRLISLVLASYTFYGWWDARFVALLFVSTVIDFKCGQLIHESVQKKRRLFWLIISLISNLGILGFFKYSGFFTRSINSLTAFIAGGGEIPVPDVILPAGISFYTFQTMSFSIDVYRRQARPTESFWHFAAYVSMFPQLIAGPIVRYTEIETQLRSIPDKIVHTQFSRGIYFFVAGMVQKVLLADLIAAAFEPLLENYQSLAFAGSWFCMLGYSCQLYFDFAGYSNMAVGLGLMLGFTFPQNFNSPYQARNISDFWRRWHMTLSNWLRDYLFKPLGGSQEGHFRTIRNLVVVMFLGGLWHGANWTFVVWGLYHGALLAAYFAIRSWKKIELPSLVGQVTTFLFVLVGWVIFRSSDMEMCGNILASMIGLHGLYGSPEDWVVIQHSLPLLICLLIIVFCLPNTWNWNFKPRWQTAVMFGSLFTLCVIRFSAESPFLYFQF
tara:strand:- start:181114 stop:182514 length:1401 start_codon:yes stop_codon:yes gene_type:complete